MGMGEKIVFELSPNLWLAQVGKRWCCAIHQDRDHLKEGQREVKCSQ